ncbi:MAG: pyridoxal phosphate-dependent aminotransferase [Termitinemataceae bacterium]|nr:MAG: pyridoxal phosphate-dependent aminotransferase [Termitinemataceae bacterium]
MVAKYVKDSLLSASMIRKLFEEGAALKQKVGHDKVFDFSIGNPDLEPPPAFHNMLLRFATEDAIGSHGYMSNAGYADVREKIAAKVSREHNVNTNGNNIVMSVGAAGALNVVLKAILNKGDEVIVCRPYFMEYRSYISNHNGTLIEADTKADFNLDISEIQKRLSDKTAAVLINSPNNPTGVVYDADTIAALSDVLMQHGKKMGRYPALIADEPYREIVYDNIVVPPVMCHYPHTIVVTSYSKNLSLPGERIGYIAVANDIDDKENLLAAFIWANRILGFVNAPALMQRVVAELTDEKCNVDVYAHRRSAFKKVLDNAGLQYINPQGTFYIFCKVPQTNKIQQQNYLISKPQSDKLFCDHLKKYYILAVPGSSFGASGYLRFAYCVSEDIINASAGAFKEAVNSYVPFA